MNQSTIVATFRMLQVFELKIANDHHTYKVVMLDFENYGKI